MYVHTKNARIELARIVMGTIFLVIVKCTGMEGRVPGGGGGMCEAEYGEGCRGGEGIAKLCPGLRG